VLALAFLAVLLVVALLAPWVAPYPPGRQFDLVADRAMPPSRLHWLGTDLSSRDLLSRVIFGARLSLAISLLAVVIASVVGTAWGALAGYVGGAVDGVMMRLVDGMLSIPRIILLLTIGALWGSPGPAQLAAVLGLTSWFSTSRLVRAEVLATKHRDFVAAARALGVGPRRILVRHLVPHALAPVVVSGALAVGHLVIVEAGLAFLGFGVPQPHASWGNIIRDGRMALTTAWWLSVFPGVALAGTVLSVNVIGERLRAALNPRQLPRP
jgi:peptide/nickel transport system permease protein